MCPYFFVTSFSRVQINDDFCHHILYELLSDKQIQINIDPYFFGTFILYLTRIITISYLLIVESLCFCHHTLNSLPALTSS